MGMIERHESEVMVARQRQPANLRLLDQIRYQLLHQYGYYRGIQEAIEAYVHRQQSASSRTPDVPRRASCPPVLRHFSAAMSYAGTKVPR
jgi:hypothetical protein